MVDLTIEEYVAQYMMIGSGNAAWVPCMLYDKDDGHQNKWNSSGAEMLKNQGATDFSLIFQLPLPTVKGSLNLYVAGTRIVLNDADNGDEVDRVYVFAYNDSGSTTIDDTGAGVNYNTAAVHDDTWTAVDVSSYHQVCLWIRVEATNADDFGLAAAMIKCYYDS